LHFVDYGDGDGNQCDPTLNCTGSYAVKDDNSPWMVGYKWMSTGHQQEIGLPIAALNQVTLKFLLHQILDSAFNPYLVGAYRFGSQRTSTNNFFQSWSDMLQAYSTSTNPCA
jgi:hypothetical protein